MTRSPGFRLLRCSLPGAEAVLADSVHAFGRHMHDQFGIGLVERGAQKSASGRGPVEACAGDMITVNPGEVHDGAPIDASGRRWRMLYLDPAPVLDSARDIAPGAPDFEFQAPVIRDASLTAHFQQLFDAATAGVDSLRSDSALLILVVQLLRPRHVDRPALVAGVSAARERMDDDPATSTTLADMARSAGLSRYQFLRAFTHLTGLPPHAYLLQRRVQLARRLVRAGTALADAAAASGFADQSHMTRCFMRNFGLTPGAMVRGR